MYGLSIQPKEVLEAGKDAADTLTQTVLGSLVILLVIGIGLVLWLAWRTKQSELETLKEVMKASADERVGAEKFAQSQTKAYEDLANVVGDGFDELKTAVKSNGIRTDALANAIPDLDTKLYYASRGNN
ncbi:hypothetical protein LCGC14_1788850 [marine sediment metagenome]|uniref:Uncharacterized protein n=1 Tax=marine sediment metagenome TaxID=412755 RepID=A0A0F9J810_9ZZZZ